MSEGGQTRAQRRAQRRTQRGDDGNAKRSADVRTQSKVCPSCQRPFHNRKKWQARGLWESIVYCSERCRRTPTQ